MIGTSPSTLPDRSGDCAVDGGPRSEVQGYLTRLSARSGRIDRLPTEAEWEYSARAGGSTAFQAGAALSTAQAHVDDRLATDVSARRELRSRSMIVARIPANLFGLHDMHGNLAEWVQDCYGREAYSGEALSDGRPLEDPRCAARVLRGGSWNSDAAKALSAIRSIIAPGVRSGSIGFRVARPVP